MNIHLIVEMDDYNVSRGRREELGILCYQIQWGMVLFESRFSWMCLLYTLDNPNNLKRSIIDTQERR